MSNFLVLMSDEHNPLYSEPYGHQSVRTPHMQALEAAGLLDTTNVVYTSDHGDMLGKFGMWWKWRL